MVLVSRRDAWFLCVIVMLSFVVRAVVFHCYLSRDNRYWQVDSNTYHLVAQGIAEGKGISLPSGAPNFYRLPGYPVFIAFFYKIFGINHSAVLWGQIILASFIPVLLFILARVLFERRRWLAYCASLLGSMHIGLVLYAGFFMTETLFIVLFLLFLIFFLRFVHLYFCPHKPETVCAPVCGDCSVSFIPDPMPMVPSFTSLYEDMMVRAHKSCKPTIVCDQAQSAPYLVLSGIFLGLASLVRPVGHYLIVVALGLLLLRKDALTVRLRQCGLLLITWLLPVSFWLIRNYLLLGSFFFHTLPGGHFLYLSAARVVQHADNVSYAQAREVLGQQSHALISAQAHDLGRDLNEIEVCRANESLARRYFIQHPLITLKLWATDIFRTCFSLYSAELLYLENGRKDIDYFDKDRTWGSMFLRYLVPHTDNNWLKGIIYSEIIVFLMILLGFFSGLCLLVLSFFKRILTREDICSWLRTLPFMALLIVVALAGGYARMRLPVEPLLIILSLSVWGNVLSHQSHHKKHNS